MSHLIRLSCLFLMFCLPVAHAQSVVVSDELLLQVWSTPGGPGSRIVANVRSGERLPLLDEADGYVKIRNAKGQEGWIQKRFVQDGPVARDQLDAAVSARDAALAAQARLEEDYAQTREALDSLKQEHDSLQTRAQRLQDELTRVSTAAASTLDIQQQNEELGAEVQRLEAEWTAMAAQLEAVDARKSQLILGAGILLVGLLLGLILPHLQPRRSNSDW